MSTASSPLLLSFSSSLQPAASKTHFNGGRIFNTHSSSRKIHQYNHRWSSLKYQKSAGRLLCSQVKLEADVDDETCELVNGIELVIGEGQDSIRAYVLKAVKNNNGTGVLLLSDVFGFEDSSTRDFAYRIACNGYNVLVPDLFRGDPWKKGYSISGFEQWLIRQSSQRVAKDIDTSTKWLVDEFTAAGISRKLGIIGFCFGGGKLIETLARDHRANFGIGVSFYGTSINTSLAKDVNVPVLFICGDNDQLCPISTLHEIEKKVKDSRVVIYNGRGHGFVHRPESQEEDADAEDAFAIMRSWLHDCLAVGENEALFPGDFADRVNNLTPDEARSYAIVQLPRETSKHTGFAFDSPGYESFFASQQGVLAPQKPWDVIRRASMKSQQRRTPKT